MRDYVHPERQRSSCERLAITLLLTYALGNADCHTKNLGFRYTGQQDVEVSPVYDMLTILAYDRCSTTSGTRPASSRSACACCGNGTKA